MTDQNTFGGRLRAFRKSKKLKGKVIGQILRVNKAQVAMIETNRCMTPTEKLIELAAAFPDLDLNWLLRGEGEMLLVRDLERERLLALLQAEREKLAAEQEKIQAERDALEAAQRQVQEERGRLQAVKDKLEGARNRAEALEELLLRHGIRLPAHRGAPTGAAGAGQGESPSGKNGP